MKLYNAVSRKSVAFNQIDARSGARVKQKLVSAAYGSEVSRDQILVWTGLQEAYLLKVWEPCTELQYALAIGFTSRFNHVSRFDKLRAGRDICPIGEIRRVDTARLKADRRKQRAQPGAARPGN